MEKISDFRQLRVWQKAMEVVKDVYQQTRDFPREELYGLTSQLRRSAISIPSNIAEGFKRFHFGDKRHFLSIAAGSVAELETQLIIAKDLGFFSEQIYDVISDKLNHVSKMLTLLRQKIEGTGNWNEVR